VKDLFSAYSANSVSIGEEQVPRFSGNDNTKTFAIFPAMTAPSNPLRIDIGEGRLLVIAGPADITRENVDAIVNAANCSLMGGGGVDGAIHAAGGPEIKEHCRKIVAQRGSLPEGHAVATTAGRLPARYVIHTVGPVWGGGHRNEAEKLASCHRESIRVADDLQLVSVAFPAISTGIFGYPVERAAPIALGAAAEALQRAQFVREVRFVLYDSGTRQHFAQAASALKLTTSEI
jgi:O-acetyl-ADP-ribose deacetylase